MKANYFAFMAFFGSFEALLFDHVALKGCRRALLVSRFLDTSRRRGGVLMPTRGRSHAAGAT